MHGWFRWILVLVALVVAVVVLRATVFRPKPIDVVVATVEPGLVEDAVTNSQAGTVRSRRRAKIGAERAGRVSKLHRREGDPARAGDRLIELDATTARTQADVARREVEATRAGLTGLEAAARLARQDFDRMEKLVADGIVSRSAWDAARGRLDGADAELSGGAARLKRAEAGARLAAEELDHMVVLAPFDGIVTQRFIEVGESILPGQPCLELMSADSLYVSAPIDEIDIGRIRQGLPARVTLDPFPGRSWHGVVSRVSPYVDDRLEQNRTLEVEIDIHSGEVAAISMKDAMSLTSKGPASLRDVRPGSSADIEIILETRENVLRVPTFAVIEGKRVLLVEDGKAVSRDVVAGLKNWEWTEIRSGLTAGVQVITNLDKQGVEAGARVVVRPSAVSTSGS
ncbi:MAG: efflux RND transporter periplasmic adaptor subunit [Candidatus Eisenbacteria bacterium]|nr:efflux RND transporter periplasmic adaptor subunit [Candidatus Eisenbacteria bacterium]